jgi:hypothetical protein
LNFEAVPVFGSFQNARNEVCAIENMVEKRKRKERFDF